MKWYDRLIVILTFVMLTHGIIRQELNTSSLRLYSSNNKLIIDMQNTRIEQNRALIVEITALYENMKNKVSELEAELRAIKK